VVAATPSSFSALHLYAPSSRLSASLMVSLSTLLTLLLLLLLLGGVMLFSVDTGHSSAVTRPVESHELFDLSPVA